MRLARKGTRHILAEKIPFCFRRDFDEKMGISSPASVAPLCRPDSKTTPSSAPGIYLSGKDKRFIQLRFAANHPGGRMVVLFLIPVLVLALVATAPAWRYSKNWGYYPAGGLGAILLLIIVLMFLNRI